MAIYKWFPIRVTGVTLNTNLIALTTVGDTQQLTATVSPANAEDKSVEWRTSDQSIATVTPTGANTATVTCVSPGTCNITVTTVDGGYAAGCGVWDGQHGWQPGTNTILYCPLDSTNGYADVTGNHTMAAYSTGYGNAPDIDGTGFYYFSGGYIASESYTGPLQGTLSMWFNKEYRGSQGDNVAWALSAHRGGSFPYHTFAMDLGVDYAETQGLVYTSNGGTITIHPGENQLGVWTQWTMTYSSTDGMKLYVNGVLAGTPQPADGTLYPYNYPTSIGGNNNGSWQRYKGYIADVIYEDKVWSAGDVAMWYYQSMSRYGL